MNEQIRIVGTSSEPWVSDCFDTWHQSKTCCTHPGMEVGLMIDIFTNLGYRNQLTFIQVFEPQQVIDMLRNGTADIAANTFPMDEWRLREFGHTSILTENWAMFLTKGSDANPLSSNLVFSSLGGSLWATLGVSVFSILFLKYLVSINVVPLAIYTMVFGCFFMVLGIVLGVYSNFLAINFSNSPASLPLFRSLAELSELLYSQQCRAVLDNSFTEDGAIFQAVIFQELKQVKQFYLV